MLGLVIASPHWAGSKITAVQAGPLPRTAAGLELSKILENSVS